jgi:hypothetical protein
MANVFNNVNDVGTVLSKLAAGYLQDNVQFCKTIDKEPEESFGSVNGYKVGDTINVNIPARFTPTTSLDITSSQQDVVEEKKSLSLDTTRTVAVNADSLEMRNDISESELLAKGERILKPAMIALAHDIEADIISKATDAIYNTVGTAGSTTFDTAQMLAAKDELARNLCPMGDRKALLKSAAMSSAVNARKGLFQSSEEIAKQYKQGYMGTADGFDFLENEMLATHTNGNDVSFEVSTTVSVEGQATLVVEGLTTTTGTVTKGTTFTIDTVNMVHPQTKQDTGVLQKFVVTADATADGSGIATLSISPAIYTSASNGLQNVTAFPADGDTCNVLTGAASTGYTQNLVYHPNAFRFISSKLFQPKNTEMSGVATEDGITVNMVSDFDINTRKEILRFDVLYGFSAIRPEWACRITS